MFLKSCIAGISLHVYTLEQTHMHTRRHLRTHTRANTQIHTRAHTHTHTHMQYTDRKMAERAALHFNNFEIAGKRMVVQISPVYSMGPSAPAPSTGKL